MIDDRDVSRRIALLGGPDSGKSTYLGVLLDALEAERIDHLRIDQYPANLNAIQRLTEPLLDGTYPQRTEYGPNTALEVRLRTRAGILPDARFDLQVADYSGEEVHTLFDDRDGWSDAWQTRSRSNAVLLFVRPAVLVEMPRLKSRVSSSEMARWRALKGGSENEGIRRHEPIGAVPEPRALMKGEAVDAPVLQPGDAVRIPTVLSLIELLQFLRHARGLVPGERAPLGNLRVAVLVSAWDSVPLEWREQGPARFLAAHVPLLEDFLWSNFHGLDVFRFGLSSTGGDLMDPAWRECYLDAPSGFVEWVNLEGRVQRHADLAMPLYWALFGEDAWNLPR